MLPLNPRELRRLMRRMGINVEELKDVKSVSILLKGQKMYQVVSQSEEVIERAEEVVEVAEFSEEDIKFVMEQAGVGREEAVRALKEAGGDIAKAILLLTNP